MSLGLQGRIMITAHRTFVPGCEGPSQVAERRKSWGGLVKPNYLCLIMHWQNCRPQLYFVLYSFQSTPRDVRVHVSVCPSCVMVTEKGEGRRLVACHSAHF